MKNRKSFVAWLKEQGVLKIISRLIMLAGLVAALVIAGMGIANMLDTRAADEATATEKKVVAAQNAEAKKRKAAAEAEAKAAEAAAKAAAEEQGVEYVPAEIAPVEIDPTTIEVSIEPVTLSLDKYVGTLFSGYLVWSGVVLIASIAVSSFVADLKNKYEALRAAGPRRVTAGTFFWVGTIAALVVLGFGCWHVLHLDIKKPTLVDVWEILRKQYLPWVVALFGTGLTLKLMILHLTPVTERTFDRVGVKLLSISRRFFQIALVLFAFGLVASIVVMCLTGLLPGAICLVSVCAAMLVSWVLSVALHALGTCTMIMEPQAQEAFEHQEAVRNATDWTCPVCATVHPNHVGRCPKCGALRLSREERLAAGNRSA